MKKSRKSWLLIAASIAIICGILAGIFFMLRTPSGEQKQENNDETDITTEQNIEQTEQIKQTENPNAEMTVEIDNQEVIDKLNSMTLEEKVAQLFILAPSQLTGPVNMTLTDETTKQALEEFPICGFIYFAENIVDPDQLLEMTTKAQNYANEVNGLPLFISTDEEGGDVARIGENPNFPVEHYPNMWEIGQAGDTSKAFEVGDKIGEYLADYGINLDFAPVADVITNPLNTVIGVRSFGEDIGLSAEMVVAVLEGLEGQGVYSCLKHFPNHGATEGDTHEGYAYSDKTLEELELEDLIPFQKGIDAGVSFVMVSHISVPNVVGDNTPATLSERMVTEILRERMGFKGIVITDAMNMGAIVNNYSPGEAAVKAIQAGVDIILMPVDFRSAYQAILNAVADEEISEERINLSVSRILAAKYKMINE